MEFTDYGWNTESSILKRAGFGKIFFLILEIE